MTLGRLYWLVFIKKEYGNSVSDYTNNNNIKTAFYGFLGNKGAIIIKFKIYDFSFIIINFHLIPGVNKLETRNKDLDYKYNNICENI